MLSPAAGLDFARNRLTHSLEVAQVGRELATSLGLDPDVVDTACLAHDLGHPPFGHNGERALNAWAADIGGFEGNAQTLRILTRLEPKVFDDEGRSFGLNLTRASLDASCKYPWPEATSVADPSGRAKFGFYRDDEAVFEWMRAGAPDRRLCIEAQVMDLSDDIAYSVHDFEDAIVNGYVDVAALGARVDHDALVSSMYEWIGGAIPHDELIAAFDRLDSLDGWLDSWSGSRARAGAAEEPHEPAHRPVRACRHRGHPVGVPAARASSGSTPTSSCRVRSKPRSRCSRASSRAFVMSQEHEAADLRPAASGAHLARRRARHHRRRSTSTPASPPTGRRPTDDEARKRAVVDQVASLTDQSALAWYERLCQ